MGCQLWVQTDICSDSVTAVLYAISCYIGPCYNGTWLQVHRKNIWWVQSSLDKYSHTHTYNIYIYIYTNISIGYLLKYSLIMTRSTFSIHSQKSTHGQLMSATHALKWKDGQGDCPGHHWRRWRKASTSPVMTRAVTLTTFPFRYNLWVQSLMLYHAILDCLRKSWWHTQTVCLWIKLITKYPYLADTNVTQVNQHN